MGLIILLSLLSIFLFAFSVWLQGGNEKLPALVAFCVGGAIMFATVAMAVEYGAGVPASLDVLERGEVHVTLFCDEGEGGGGLLLVTGHIGPMLYSLDYGVDGRYPCPPQYFVAVEVEGKLQLLPYENMKETSSQ